MSGNANTGTWFGTDPHWAVDGERQGHVMTFNGSGDNDAGVMLSQEIPITEPFTVCAWVRYASGSPFAPFLAGRSTGTAAIFYNSKFFYWISDANGIAWAELKTIPAQGEWFHVAMVSAFGGASIRTYQNGVYANLNPFNIGAVTIGILGRGQYSSTWGSWNDRLDDFRIYNRALSADEIRNIHDCARVAPLSDLIEPMGWEMVGGLVVPTKPALQWSLGANPIEWSLEANPVEWTPGANPFHWTLESE